MTEPFACECGAKWAATEATGPLTRWIFALHEWRRHHGAQCGRLYRGRDGRQHSWR